jgi:hypothetical protein
MPAAWRLGIDILYAAHFVQKIVIKDSTPQCAFQPSTSYKIKLGEAGITTVLGVEPLTS